MINLHLLLILGLGLVIGIDCSSEGIKKIKEIKRYCKQYNEDPGWQCKDGSCLSLNQVCDGISTQCGVDDPDDEEIGCRLFPDSSCMSWRGQRHVPCHQDSFMCTLPKYSNSDCRQCEKPNEWRCDDGFCIKQEFKEDGHDDCEDGSDEKYNNDSVDNSDSGSELNIFTSKF